MSQASSNTTIKRGVMYCGDMNILIAEHASYRPPPNSGSTPGIPFQEMPDKIQLEEVARLLQLESDFPFNAISAEQIKLLLVCRSSNEIYDILGEVNGFYDPYFDITTRLIVFINSQRSQRGMPPSTFVAISRDTSEKDGGPILALLNKEPFIANDPSNPYYARLSQILAEGANPSDENTVHSPDYLKFFVSYPPASPYRSHNYSIPGSEGKLVWRYYESWADGFIPNPSYSNLDGASLQDGDIYLHTRFQDIGQEQRAEHSQVWQWANKVWHYISPYYAKAGRNQSIYHPFNDKYVVYPTYQGVPRYMEATDAKIARILRGEF